MGFHAIVTIDRTVFTYPSLIGAPLARLLNHNSHVDGVRHSPTPHTAWR